MTNLNKQITFTCIYINNDKITNVIKEDVELQKENIKLKNLYITQILK